METIFDIARYLITGFFGLIMLLVILGAFFGKRISKKWEFEADFRDENGREFGEFEIELSHVDKEESDYTLKAQFQMRHPALLQHATVQVYVENTLVFEQMVETEGRMYVQRAPLVNRIEQVSAGQICRVMVGSTEIASAEFRSD